MNKLFIKVGIFCFPIFCMAKGLAVIVNTGDIGGLQSQMDNTTKLGADVYRDAGYDVIVLSPAHKDNPPDAETLRRVLSQAKGYNDLKLDFIGHGGLAEIPKNLADRFPPLQFTEEQKKAGFLGYPVDLWNKSNVGWFAANSQNGELYLMAQDPIEKSKSRDELVKNSIGVGDIKESISKFQENNKDALTTLHLLNCFSGSVGTQLSDMKNVQVFSGTSSEQVNVATSEELAKNGFRAANETAESRLELIKKAADNSNLIMYYRELRGLLQSGSQATAWDIENAVQNRYRSEMPKEIETSFGYKPPRSSISQYVMNWCAEHPEKSTKVAQELSSDQKKVLSIMEKETSSFYSNLPKCNDQCLDDSEVAKKLSETIRAQAQISVNEFVEKLQNADSNVQLQAVIKNILTRQAQLQKAIGLPPDDVNKKLQVEFQKYQSDPKKYVSLFVEKVKRLMKSIEQACDPRGIYSENCHSEAMFIADLNAMFQPGVRSSRLQTFRNPSKAEVLDHVNKAKELSAKESLGSLVGIASSIRQECDSCSNKKAVFEAPEVCRSKFAKGADAKAWTRAMELYAYGQKNIFEFEKDSTQHSKSSRGTK